VSTPDTDPSAAKATARAEARARRRSGPPPDAQGLADQVMGLLERLPGPPRVTCYASYGTEPETGRIRERLASAGFDVLLPRVAGDDMAWVIDEGAAEVSSMGIAEPVGPAAGLLPVRAMLVPALAVTLRGDRLGKGGGYYDRALASLGDSLPPIAAIVGDDDVVTSLPTQAHDHRVDLIVTPTRIIRCASD
jgi:5-formyltetrahydrofolate cyclo-ligase